MLLKTGKKGPPCSKPGLFTVQAQTYPCYWLTT